MASATAPTDTAVHVNTQWFKDRLADKKLSVRGYARLVEMDPSAVSRMFTGGRLIQMAEAVAFASVVNVPLEDVMANAGLRPPVNVKGSTAIVGYVDANGAVHRGQVDAPRRAPTPPELSDAAVAVRFETGATAASALDGWLAYFQDLERIPADAVGRLCVATLGNHGGARIAFVRRGYERGTYTLAPWAPGATLLENVQLVRASPVLWIRTAL